MRDLANTVNDKRKEAKEAAKAAKEAEAELKEKDVQDGEMADFYSSMSSTIAKKFTTKRNYHGGRLTPPAASASASSTSNLEYNPTTVPSSSTDILQKGQNYVQGMRHQNVQWRKDQHDFKRRKMVKPSTD